MIVALEGIDGAGKQTQAALLKYRAETAGVTAAVLSFPRYGKTAFADDIKAYLDGNLGDPTNISPRIIALLFAGDRLESRHCLITSAGEFNLLILDRYVASNLAYQGARLPPDRRENFIKWLANLEYNIFEMPKADLTVLLDVPTEVSLERTKARTPQDGTHIPDLNEMDSNYLTECRRVYGRLAESNLWGRWLTVPGVATTGRGVKPAEICRSIWDVVKESL